MTEPLVLQELRRTAHLMLELLRRLPEASEITCHQCSGESPEPEFCGCGGKQTVGEAIRWYESQLETLDK